MSDNDERISKYIQALRNMTRAEYEELHRGRYPELPEEDEHKQHGVRNDRSSHRKLPPDWSW